MAAGRYDLIVVGMGSAGVVAAEFAASLGVKVCAIERGRVGGDCLWTGCVPSKALLATAHAAHAMRTADRLGLPAVEPEIDTAAVFARIRAVQDGIAATDDDPERFRALGVDVRLGEPARLEGPHAVRVGDEVLETRHLLLCTGSEPAVPPIDGLSEAGFLTSESVWDIERAPASLLLVGGGPIAVEMAQALRRLASDVTILERGHRLLHRDEPELADRLVARLREEGVRIELGVELDRVTVEDGAKVVHAGDRRWAAQEIFVGAGRRPNAEGLGLETIGVAPGPDGSVAVDDRSRTQASSVYAVGDLTGGYQFTHAAATDAARAVRDMFFPGAGRAGALIPWVTFTDPELAHAGLTSAEASERHGADDVEVHRIGLERSDRARAEAAEDGAVVAVTHKGRLVGAHVLAPAAGELIGELALAIEQGMRLSELASVVHVYPTFSTSIAQLAAEAAYARAGRYRWLVRT
ncbi:MAG: FAD-dependent oxidoreductase [Actinomycetota bacterium]|nr:FAD-dependent oxidoreductase [Actinomycetota bacterium]